MGRTCHSKLAQLRRVVLMYDKYRQGNDRYTLDRMVLEQVQVPERGLVVALVLEQDSGLVPERAQEPAGDSGAVQAMVLEQEPELARDWVAVLEQEPEGDSGVVREQAMAQVLEGALDSDLGVVQAQAQAMDSGAGLASDSVLGVGREVVPATVLEAGQA
jgi:hypothetical protein